MVVGVLDKGIRKKLLQESKLTLQSCIDICRANECTKQQLQEMDQPEEVHALDKKETPRDDRRNSKLDLKLIKCKFCAKMHEARPVTNVARKITSLLLVNNARRPGAGHQKKSQEIDNRDQT